MIKIVNRKGMPEPLASMLMQKEERLYSGSNEKKDYSCTQLLKPTREILLYNRIKDDPTRILEIDVDDLWWTVFGSIVHYIFEVFADMPEVREYLLSEKRFKININGKIVSGGIDLYDKKQKLLLDYKYTSVYNAMYGGREEWTPQLNLYKVMLEEAGYEVKGIKVLMLFKDWSESQISRDGYPKNKYQEMLIPVLPKEDVLKIFSDKIKELEAFDDIPDGHLPICSAKERWESASVVRVVSSGGRVYFSKEFYDDASRKIAEEECQKYLFEKNYKNTSIQVVRGKSKKCNGYCSVRSICKYGVVDL